MVDYADIGKRIRACRLAKGMTQEQLANEVGVVVTHISHIETGNSVPAFKMGKLWKVYRQDLIQYMSQSQ